MDKNTTNKSKRIFPKMPMFKNQNQQKNATSAESKNTASPDKNPAPKKKTLLQIATDYEKEKQAKLKGEAKTNTKTKAITPPSSPPKEQDVVFINKESTNGWVLP